MIKAEIYNQKIKLDCESVASDSVKYLKIKFFLDDDWEGTTKTAVFANVEQNITVSVILEEGNPLYLGDNTCYVPYEVIKPPFFSVNISGLKGDSVITTLPESIRVYQSGDISAESGGVYTPSQYEQLVSIYEETKEIAQSVRNDADNGAFNGEKGEDGKDAEIDPDYNPLSENAQSGKAVAEALEGYAPVIKQTAIGNPIIVNDVSPNEHDLKVKVKSANLVHYPYTATFPQTQGNVTINLAEDGLGIVVNGTIPTPMSYYFAVTKITLSAGTYSLTKFSENAIGNCNFLVMELGANCFTLTKEETLTLALHICNFGDSEMEVSGTFYPMLVKDTKLPTEYVSPLISLEGVTVSRYGKNIFNPKMLNKAADGEIFTFDEESGYYKRTYQGAYGASFISHQGLYIESGKNLTKLIKIPKGCSVTVTIYDYHWNNTTDATKNDILMALYNADGTQYAINSAHSQSPLIPTNITRTYAANDSDKWLDIGTSSRDHFPKYFSKIQVELNSMATEYEPYKEVQIITSDANGIVNGFTNISPNMTMITDDDFILDCEYNADTKMYIDNKFEELKKLI